MGHVASLSQLQNPPWALVNGELMPYEDVRIHISAEALTRALSVFEGMKGYWNDRVTSSRSELRTGTTTDFGDRPHYCTFLSPSATRSCRRSEDPRRAVADPRSDLWFRTTLYVTQGHWGEGTVADLS